MTPPIRDATGRFVIEDRGPKHDPSALGAGYRYAVWFMWDSLGPHIESTFETPEGANGYLRGLIRAAGLERVSIYRDEVHQCYDMKKYLAKRDEDLAVLKGRGSR